MIIKKFIIIEIRENHTFNNYSFDFNINSKTYKGYDTYTEAKKKLEALDELKQNTIYDKTQFQIIEINFNSSFQILKKTA